MSCFLVGFLSGWLVTLVAAVVTILLVKIKGEN
jgi:hypothetical protein